MPDRVYLPSKPPLNTAFGMRHGSPPLPHACLTPHPLLIHDVLSLSSPCLSHLQAGRDDGGTTPHEPRSTRQTSTGIKEGADRRGQVLRGHSRGLGEAGQSTRARGKQDWGLPPGGAPMEGPGHIPRRGRPGHWTDRACGQRRACHLRINSRGPWRPVPVQLPLFLQGSQGEFPSVTGGVYDFINCTCGTARVNTQTPSPHPPHSLLTPRVSTALAHPASPHR